MKRKTNYFCGRCHCLRQNWRRTRIVSLVLTIGLLVSGLFTQYGNFINLPEEQKLIVGEPLQVNLPLPSQALERLSFHVTENDQGVLSLNNLPILNSAYFNILEGEPVAVSPGKAHLQLRLFGLIPIKELVVDVIPPIELIPGGHSLGVVLNSKGVMVVGFAPLLAKSDTKMYPARDAGIQIGDLITSINGVKITSEMEMAKIIQSESQKQKNITFEINRKGKVFLIEVKPSYCKETGSYRIGLFVRDSAAGVGTMTFIDPKTNKYGALGHVISDTDTQEPIKVGDGKVMGSSIQSIQKGQKGRPGEKVGIFVNDNSINGNIELNTKVGIFGQIKGKVSNPYHEKPIPIASASQVEEGKATILTVVKGETIEEFQIEIKKVLSFDREDSKGMIIEVTDSDLLEKTGGIVQGMSGSPIIQGGRIIGAVTHVFVNDPTKGYGVFIEKMLIEGGIIGKSEELKEAS